MYHCLLDPTGVIVWMSSDQPDMVYQPSILGKKPWELTADPESSSALRAAFTKAAIDQEVVRDIECVVLNKDGGRVFVRAMYEPVDLPVRCVASTYWEVPVALQDLSARETEVLALIAQGLTTQQIADQLGISLSTAESHRTNTQQKTGLNILQLVRILIESKLK